MQSNLDQIEGLTALVGYALAFDAVFPIHETIANFAVVGVIMSLLTVFKVWKHAASYFFGAGSG